MLEEDTTSFVASSFASFFRLDGEGRVGGGRDTRGGRALLLPLEWHLLLEGDVVLLEGDGLLDVVLDGDILLCPSTAGSAISGQKGKFSISGCIGPILDLRPDSESSRKFAFTMKSDIFSKLRHFLVTVTALQKRGHFFAVLLRRTAKNSSFAKIKSCT